jgi:hypothetical protein
MKKVLLISLLVLVGLAATAKKYVPERGDYTFKTRLCTKQWEEDTLADSIITYLTDKAGRIDTLVSWAIPLDIENWTGFGEILEEDINFDGIPDLQICLGPFNAFGNFTYDGLVWDQDAHKFVRVENYSEIFDPQLSLFDNRIIGLFRLDSDLTISVYEWHDGKLVLIEERDEKWPTGEEEE